MRELSLFSGGGGGLLASRLLGWRMVGYVERDAYCREVIAARIRDGMLDDAPIHEDVRTFDAAGYRGLVDVVSAGFPCPPFSVAGKGLAGKDPRNLWPETLDVVRRVRPCFVFLENVPGLLGKHGYFGTVLGGLAALGFNAEWCVLGADDLGAPHRRKRLWVLAYLPDAVSHELWDVRERLPGGWPGGVRAQGDAEPRDDGQEGSVAHTYGRGREERGEPQHGDIEGAPWHEPDRRGSDGRRDGAWWASDPADGPPESAVGRVVDGFPGRVAQVRALGNAQVPVVAARAFEILMARAIFGLPEDRPITL